jgi:putative ABC transport system permease protein
MTPSLPSLAGWRHLLRHPWQLALAVLGVALGVSVVVAVDLANSSAERAFLLSMEDVSGRATDQIVGGSGGLDESVYTRLRLDAGIRRSAPMVEGYARAGAETLHVLGIDPFAEPPFRSHLAEVSPGAFRRLISEAGTVLMARRTARRLGVSPGEALEIVVAGRAHRVTVIGMLEAGPAGDGLMIADIATAQELVGMIGRLSWIDLVLPSGARGDAVRERVHAVLPSGVDLVPAAARADSMRQMTRAFRTNLTAMSLLALLVGAFLIYNTITFTVVQRRGLIAELRVLGVTRGEVFAAVLREVAVIGVLGTVPGLAAGIALAQGLVRLVTRTINDLYFVVSVTEPVVSGLPLWKGAAVGVLGALAAALVPALEAARTEPRAALARSSLEVTTRRFAARGAVLGIVLIIAAAVGMALPFRDLLSGFIVLFLLVIGLAMMTPLALAGASHLLAPPAGHRFGLTLRLAVRGVAASLSRTGVAVAALMLAVSTAVGVSVMVESFRSTVELWLESTLQADVYVSAPSELATRTQASLDPAVVAAARRLKGTATVSTGRLITVQSGRGLVRVLAIDPGNRARPGMRLKAGDADHAWDWYEREQAVLVSEPLAHQRGLSPGDALELRTDTGVQRFAVAGVFYDYESGPGKVLMPRSLFDRFWIDRSVGAIGLYLADGAAAEEVMARLRGSLGGEQRVLIRSNRDVRRVSLEIFDRTFTITSVLRLLAVMVAIAGILSALMAVQLERARELAVLRAVGVTPGQLRAMVLLQTGFLGLTAGILAVPTGLVLAVMLIEVINTRSFGWSMQMLIPPGPLVGAVVLSLGAALLAGAYPAWKMSQASPAEALREE